MLKRTWRERNASFCWLTGCPLLRVQQRTRFSSLSEYAHSVLTSDSPRFKAEQTEKAKIAWNAGKISTIFAAPYDSPTASPPPAFARPEYPKLLGKRDMPDPKTLTEPLAVILLHSLAHIELNAVDLGWDLILRFRDPTLPKQFYKDWLTIMGDEARHFTMLAKRLESLDSYYGALPAHDSLQLDCEMTADSLKSRLAVIQLVREARGLDSWERLVNKFYGCQDHHSAVLIDGICRDEIFHVDRGLKWFKFLCERDKQNPVQEFHNIVKRLDLKISPPFNKKVRAQAGMDEEWYIPIQHLPKHQQAKQQAQQAQQIQ